MAAFERREVSEHLNLAVFVAGHQTGHQFVAEKPGVSVPLDAAALLVNPCLRRNRGFPNINGNYWQASRDLLSDTPEDLQSGACFSSS